MRKEAYLIMGLLVLFSSCKKENAVKLPTPETTAAEVSVVEACYLGILKKDTVTMSLKIKGNQVLSGHLDYNYFEKIKIPAPLQEK